MNKKAYVALNVVLILAVAGLFVYTYMQGGGIDNKTIMKGGLIMLACVLNMFRQKSRSGIGSYAKYEEAYKDILKGAFAEDKKSYKQLMRAIAYFNQDKSAKMHKILDSLERKCMRTKDYAAVYTFRALAYEDEKLFDKAILAYEKVLQYDMANTTAWSNLGLRYKEAGKIKEAYEAYSKAILYEPKNAYAYNNMASFFLDVAEPEAALEYAQKSIELNSNVYQAMSAAAIACKLLGDDENAEKYCKMYGMNGGNMSALRQKLAEM